VQNMTFHPIPGDNTLVNPYKSLPPNEALGFLSRRDAGMGRGRERDNRCALVWLRGVWLGASGFVFFHKQSTAMGWVIFFPFLQTSKT
jgi:hypothetical protein